MCDHSLVSVIRMSKKPIKKMIFFEFLLITNQFIAFVWGAEDAAELR